MEPQKNKWNQFRNTYRKDLVGQQFRSRGKCTRNSPTCLFLEIISSIESTTKYYLQKLVTLMQPHYTISVESTNLLTKQIY